MKKALLLSILVSVAVVAAPHVPVAQADTATGSLQNQIDTYTQQVAQINQQIAQYEAEIQQANSDKQTLQNAINVLNLQQKKVQAQISATQNQIATTQLQITQLGASITNAGQAIETDQTAIADGLRTLQESDNEPLIMVLLSSQSLSQAWSAFETTLEIENAIESNISALQTQKNVLAASQAASQQKQDTLTSQKKSLSSQQATLVQNQKTKKQLLAETNAKESTYEQLLAQAKAQLASFSAFTQNAGGAGLLAGQTSCDQWGCYYNQRDAQWGNDPLNGTQYKLKSDGCLITAMAMVLTHYGYRDVTPVTINSNPGNFAAYYPAYLLFTISVDGITATRKTALIDTTLSTGNPVVVGLKAYGGTHYVVLVSGSKGNYLMRDPYIAGGDDISFSAHYSLKSVFGISKVSISG